MYISYTSIQCYIYWCVYLVEFMPYMSQIYDKMNAQTLAKNILKMDTY